MSIEVIGEKALSAIRDWSAGGQRLVIGVDGIPGSGKTSLLNYLEEEGLSVLSVHIDDFMTPVDFRKLEVDKLDSLDEKVNFFTKNWFEYQDIRELVIMFQEGTVTSADVLLYRNGFRTEPYTFDLTKQILILEGIMLYNPELIDDLWDRRIFVDGDWDVIKQRRMDRERQRWGESYISEDDDPNSWYTFILEGVKRYEDKYQPKKRADLVLINHLD